jgi:hypothetical protein
MAGILTALFRMSDTTSKLERCFGFLVCALSVVVPIFFLEMFPFSRFPMFSDNSVVLVRSKVFDAAGKQLALEQVGILDTYVVNPDPMLNTVPQRPHEAAYRWWEPYEFAPFIQAEIRLKGLAEPVRFVQEQLGVVTRAGRTSVGVVGSRAWKVTSDGAQLESP